MRTIDSPEVALRRKHDKVSAPGLRTTALVVDADPPVSNESRWGNVKGTVTILVDNGSDGPIYVARNLRLTEDRWLVRGMEIPVSIDPAKPERFEIDWDAIPSIEQRVAANDPTLADPSATQRKIAAALESASVSGPAQGMARRGMAGGGATGTGPTADHLDEAIQKAAKEPAPPGKQRAVVVIAAITSGGDSSSGGGVDPNTNGPP
jgi:hypothetical protein